MIERIKKIYNPKWVEMFYILLPIVEVITTFTILKFDISLTLGMVYKTLFILYSLVYLIFIDERKRGINKIFISIFAIVSIINIVVTIDGYTVGNIARKIIDMSKYICFPITLMFLYKYILNGNKVRLITLVYSATIYATVILLGGITGTSLPTYDSAPEFGQSGWFYSGNEISILMGMFYPIVIYYVSKYKKPIFIFSAAAMTYGLLVIGTKTSFLAIVLTVGLTFVFGIFRYFTKKSEISKNMIIVSIILIAIIISCAKISPSLKYIADRIQIADSRVKAEGITGEDTKKAKITNLMFNGREKYAAAQMKVYEKATFIEKAAGIKDINKVRDDNGESIDIERDTYDIIIKYGILGLVIYFIPIILILLMFAKKVITNLKEECNERNFIIAISVMLALGVSYIAGHVLLAPTVAIFLAIIFSKLNEPDDMELLEMKKKLKQKGKNQKPTMLITLPKLSVGGMELSAINLLNLSDYTKNYDVTLMIGYIVDKELINKLPTDIRIKLLCNDKWNIFGKLVTALNYFEEYIKFKFKLVKYDVAICYSHHHGVLASIARLASDNNICFIHSDIEKARTTKQISKMKFDKFKKIVCVSNASKKSFENIFSKYNGEVLVANNYIDGEKILKLSEEKINENIEYIENKTIFINICRHLESVKKVSRILESSKRLKEEGYNFIVWLIGDGEDTENYKEYVKENNLSDTVIFIGKKLNPYNYLKVSSALVFPSEFEGYGIVLDEARILNIPIISTDVADAKNIIKDGYGILCENNIEGVYSGMKTFLNKGFKETKKFNYIEFNNNITEVLNQVVKK